MGNCEDIIEFTTQCRDLFLAKSVPRCQYPALVIYLLDFTDATKKTKAVLIELRNSETHMTKHYKDPEQHNRTIIDRLRHHPVIYLLEKFLNMRNKTLNVEVRTERLHRTMQVLEERHRNSNIEPIHTKILKATRYQAFTYYEQQEKVDAIIKADKLPDGSEGLLSDMKHTVFHSLTEANGRAAPKSARDNSQAVTHSQSQNGKPTATKRHKPDNGALKQIKSIGQPQEKKGAREDRACPYCKVMPAPQRFSLCPMKASYQTKQAEERVKNDVQIARLSNTSGKVEDITDGDEH
ncbi:hypothetical protein SARC_02820 [Sphaeroforma arctica JP610]|uniref:Uncharacterized protein n=1 Tax=Sphaeroforma arctica JP610 TaxID=667725 RepID=A0A0L0G7I8_9EUKA|nr:hypothetical protein SARC_02820 [Sphaeroforma arctica JP610]KNC84965.1 hypothetical protein SARC_02820 [Sphaeroforma arctica JP610]|eukprot:XP_014158867.1 hypothetical protein SARC_02820 [Sphaeroforma arctica JP610]